MNNSVSDYFVVRGPATDMYRSQWIWKFRAADICRANQIMLHILVFNTTSVFQVLWISCLILIQGFVQRWFVFSTKYPVHLLIVQMFFIVNFVKLIVIKQGWMQKSRVEVKDPFSAPLMFTESLVNQDVDVVLSFMLIHSVKHR